MAGRHRRADESRPTRGRWLAVVGAVVVVVALAVVLPLVLLGGGGDGSSASGNPSTSSPTSSVTTPSTTPPTTPPSTTTSTSAAPTTTPPPTKTTTKASPTPPPPTLVVRADRASSWLTVTDEHGRVRFNALVPRGKTERFDGPFFHVVVGYPPGVLVTTNGKQQPRGGPGHVLRFDVRKS